jgi:hypothetical protein
MTNASQLQYTCWRTRAHESSTQDEGFEKAKCTFSSKEMRQKIIRGKQLVMFTSYNKICACHSIEVRHQAANMVILLWSIQIRYA